MFLCSQNKRRSLTAEKIFENVDDIKARSAGTENNARIKVTAGMIGWADIIFTMEKKHSSRIMQKYKNELINKKFICLYISDDYEFMDRELINILEEKVNNYLISK